MEGNPISNVIETHILELEDKLMDLILISSSYEYIPVPIFETEMNIIIKELEYLEYLVRNKDKDI
ncbi:hypothetical protein LCGC14_0842180 [marine sediment metagenome]|uniref:Uncharacterized protein n=1 Tax=marine sediment metagenome TaxID=412755 RepID=A0A0F9PHH7_9ZZZZ